jgi:hypothetical protein
MSPHLANANPSEFQFTVNQDIRALVSLDKMLGDVPSATAILDRFMHHAEIIAITGRSYRLRNQAVGNPAGEDSKPANAPTGSDEGDRSKPAIVLTGSLAEKPAEPITRSSLRQAQTPQSLAAAAPKRLPKLLANPSTDRNDETLTLAGFKAPMSGWF